MVSMFAKWLRLAAGMGLALSILAANSSAQDNRYGYEPFRLSSTTFAGHMIMPLSTINNSPGSNGTNSCSIDGSLGGNQSPELSWTGAPPNTQTFVVTAFDVTASFTHWGMYNIPGNVNSLPENAGVANSPYGLQVENDFGTGAAYGGPCPPANVAPFVHHYVLTVYALDIRCVCQGPLIFPLTERRYTTRSSKQERTATFWEARG